MSYKQFTREQYVESFWKKVDQNGPGECWSWKACKNRDGYGTVRFLGVSRLAHRIAFLLVRGEIPKGMQIDHVCRNRWCVNPLHMDIVTSSENTKRARPWHPELAKTHCPKRHPYDDKNTKRDRRGHRFCRACHAEDQRRRDRRIRYISIFAAWCRVIDNGIKT